MKQPVLESKQLLVGRPGRCCAGTKAQARSDTGKAVILACADNGLTKPAASAVCWTFAGSHRRMVARSASPAIAWAFVPAAGTSGGRGTPRSMSGR
ncbi:MAG: hypothetical protein ACJ76W_11970, partial [Chloroflexota bacterium]